MEGFRLSALSFHRNVSRVPATAGDTPHTFKGVPFVQAQVMPPISFRMRAADRNAVQRFLRESHVMHIGTRDHNAQWNAAAIGQHRPLGAQLASIRGVFPGFFPLPAELWSSCHREIATSIGCATGGRIPAVLASIVAGTRDAWSTPESSDAGCCRNQIGVALLSRGSRCASHSRCHPQPSVRQVPDAHPWGWAANVESASSFASKSDQAISTVWKSKLSWVDPP